MNKLKKRFKKKPILIFTIIFFILLLFGTTCLVYSILNISNVENILRYLVSILLVFIVIYLSLTMIKIIFKGKNPAIILFDIILIIIFTITSYASITINNFYGGISSFYKETTTYEVSGVTKKDSNINDIKNIKDNKIGIISEVSKKELNEISIELINENKLKDNNEIKIFDSSIDVMNALYDNEIDVAFVPSNYISMFDRIDKYKKINEETKELIKKSKTVKKDNENNNKDESEPFTVLLLGMDSTIKDISTVTSFNADSIMLLTFNPKTYNATILSIPRDTYVPIGCLKGLPESKITHSGWNGESCVIKTINNWMNIDVDYYVKVNFTALVSLVDSIGGIEVDVPYSFCEQDSNREWGDKTVYVKKGLQTLNGEQALALTRNRHPNPLMCSSEWTNYYSDDIIRGQNQQLVINALINKVVKNLSLEKIQSIIEAIDKNVDTNLQIDKITSYYNVAKKLALKTLNSSDNVINFERLHLSTYGKSMYDPLLNLGGMSMQIYYEESFNQILDEMKVNLNLEKPTLIKTFNFSINKPYVKEIIGKGDFKATEIKTVPNFVGQNKTAIESWAYENGITLIFEYKESDKENDTIISQSIKPSYRLDKINKNETFKIVLSKYTPIIENNVEDDIIEKDPLQDLLPQENH